MNRKKVIEYLELHVANFPSCKILEYKTSAKYTFKKNYRTIKSNRQIGSLIEISKTKRGMKVYHRLLQLLSKKIYVMDYTGFLTKFINKNLTDDQIYNILKKYKRKKHFVKGSRTSSKKKGKKAGGNRARSETMQTQLDTGFVRNHAKRDLQKLNKYSEEKEEILKAQSYEECTKNVLRAQIYSCTVDTHILKKDKKFKIENYLDMGCGDCTLTKTLGNALGLSDKNIYGADIPEWGGYNEKTRKKLPINIIDLKKGKKLPIKSNKFSLVTAFMMLHHVENLDDMLNEINRIIKKGGYFMIREHDAMNYADYMLCDIEHMLFDVVDRGSDKNKLEYYAEYYDWVEWDYMLNNHGFEHIYSSFISDSVHYELTSTRAFYAIYKKR